MAKPKGKKTKVLLGEGGKTPGGSSNTSLVMKCPKAYQYGEVRRIRRPLAQLPAHFAVGTMFGAMRRVHFSFNFDLSNEVWKLMRRAAQRDAELSNLTVDVKDIMQAESMMGAYIDYWKLRPQPRPLAAELFLGPVRFDSKDPKGSARTARLDDLSYYPELGGALGIGEAKTTSADESSIVREYELHVQPLLYTAVYQHSKRGEAKFGPIGGLVLDVAFKQNDARKKPRFAKIPIPIRKEAVAAFIKSARFYTSLAANIGWDDDVMRTYRCTEMHGRMRTDCEFKDLCRFGRSAAHGFVTEDGKTLTKHKPEPGKEKMPWE